MHGRDGSSLNGKGVVKTELHFLCPAITHAQFPLQAFLLAGTIPFSRHELSRKINGIVIFQAMQLSKWLKSDKTSTRQSRRLRPLEKNTAPSKLNQAGQPDGESLDWDNQDATATQASKLPSYVVRNRGQKKCTYCKHPIDEDPYNCGQNFWLQYLLFQLVSLLIEVLRIFSVEIAQDTVRLRERITLAGWVRCRTTNCGQLYHANCWYRLKIRGGCSRCHSKSASRIV